MKNQIPMLAPQALLPTLPLEDGADLPPLPDSPAKKREERVRKRALKATKDILRDILAGFDENPARCLRLLGEFSTSQRELLANLEVQEERKSQIGPLGATAHDTMLRDLFAFIKEVLTAQLEMQKKKAAPRIEPTSYPLPAFEDPNEVLIIDDVDNISIDEAASAQVDEYEDA
jgi:hypothetical protein